MQHSSQIRKQLEIMCIHSAFHLYLCHHAFRVLTHLSSRVPMYTFRIRDYRSFPSPYSCLLSLQSSLRLHSYHLCVLTDFCVPASSYYFYRLLCSSLIGKLLQMFVFLYHFTAPAVFYVPVSSHCHYWFVFPTNPLVPADFCVPVSSLYSADYFVPVSSPCCTDFCVPVSSLCACWFLCTRFISLPLLISCVLVTLVG